MLVTLFAAVLSFGAVSAARAQESLEQAKQRAKAARGELEASTERLEHLKADFYANQRQLDEARRRARLANARYQRARHYLNRQAASLVRSGGASVVESLLDQDARQVVQRMEFVDVVMRYQTDWVEETRQAQEAYEAALEQVEERTARQQALLEESKRERAKLEARFRDARRRLLDHGGLASQEGLEGIAEVLGGLACPLERPYTFIDSWGFARSGGRRHKGTDIMAPRGATVFAYADGTVFKAGNIGGLAGLGVMIKHPGGVETRYYHLDSVKATTGQEVRAGEVIGTNGSTGNASVGGEHVHFEYHVGGRPVNPFPFVAKVCDR